MTIIPDTASQVTGGLENPLTGFFTWNAIGSYTGATTATLVMVRVAAVSGVDWFKKIPMVAQAYLIAVGLLIAADFALPPPPTATSITLCLVNAAGVAITVLGGNAVLGLPTSHGAGDKPKA